MQNLKKIIQNFLVFILVLASPFFTLLEAKADVLLNGAGATFPFPIYSKWFYEYNKLHPDIRINYQSIGSGGGIRQITARTVDFGASDAPLNDEQLNKMSSPILHIPTVMGAVAVIYNMPGVENLNLSGDVIADIYLGKIKKWNDDQIANINPKIILPNRDILVVHRSDGSGTTNIFTDYLSKISTEWAAKVGKGTSVNWPAGVGAKGNEGVSGAVKQNSGAIGYAELAYAELNHLSTAAVKNRFGDYVNPSIEAVTAAALGAFSKIPSDYRVSITNAPGKNVYPISGFTWLLVYQNQTNKEKGEILVEFLKWAISPTAQKYAKELLYAPLPEKLISKVSKTINGITY
jgi:phosphate transport system substrate-binding protein